MSINDVLDKLKYSRTRLNHIRAMLKHIDNIVDTIESDPVHDPIRQSLKSINDLTSHIGAKVDDIDYRLIDSIGRGET